MKFFVALALFLVVASAAVDRRAQFKNWMAEHNKSYSSVAEQERRFQIFLDNAAIIARHNAESHSWELGFNAFADLTHEEFLATYLQPAFSVAEDVPAVASKVDAYSNVNWVTAGAVVAIKDQGQCGSCWSFSATGAIEGAWKISGHSLTSFSEQQAVDCASRLKYGCGGCNGGSMDGAFKYYIDTGYIETEAEYPYTAVQGTCVAAQHSDDGHISKYSDVKSKSEDDLFNALSKQPVSVAIDASLSSFQLYNKGVYCPSGCSTTTLDHGVLAVGYDTTQTAWYVRNSWGTSWGIKGYFYLCSGQNECGIATMASYPTV